MNILLFDRSEYIRTMIPKSILQFQNSLKINSVDNMTLAMEELNNSFYDLIILDMDNLEGKFNLFLKARQKYNQNTFVIMLSSFPDKVAFDKFKKCGVEYCLDKESEFENLLMNIKYLLGEIEKNGFDYYASTARKIA